MKLRSKPTKRIFFSGRASVYKRSNLNNKPPRCIKETTNIKRHCPVIAAGVRDGWLRATPRSDVHPPTPPLKISPPPFPPIQIPPLNKKTSSSSCPSLTFWQNQGHVHPGIKTFRSRQLGTFSTLPPPNTLCPIEYLYHSISAEIQPPSSPDCAVGFREPSREPNGRNWKKRGGGCARYFVFLFAQQGEGESQKMKEKKKDDRFHIRLAKQLLPCQPDSLLCTAHPPAPR